MRKYRFLYIALFIAFSCAGTVPEGNGGTDTPEGPSGGDTKVEGALIADGNDAGTYALITSSGYNYETPDNSGEHASSPFRHIRQSYDGQLGKWVFDFILHIDNDDDRGKPNVTDRQRNEIKTDGKSPENMVAQEGETLRMTWKFKLPDGMKTTTSFSHIHQLKGIDNSEGTADVSMPIITFTVRSMSSGGQQFQVIYVGPTSSHTGNVYLAKLNLDEFLGEWVEATETVTFSGSGSYGLQIRRISDGKVLLEVSEDGLALWRDGSTGIRPKWGLYRNFGENGSNKDQLRDETLKFADFRIEKLV